MGEVLPTYKRVRFDIFYGHLRRIGKGKARISQMLYICYLTLLLFIQYYQQK